MAGIGRSLSNHAGLKALALLAALALWVLVSLKQSPQERSEASFVETAVPVEPAWSGAESSDFIIEEFTVVPASLRIAGPADRAPLLNRLVTQPIEVAAIAAGGSLEAAVILPDPRWRFIDNPTVRVEVKVRRR